MSREPLSSEQQLRAALIWCLKRGVRADPFGTYIVRSTTGHDVTVKPPPDLRETLDGVRTEAIT